MERSRLYRVFAWQDASAVAKGVSIDIEKADGRRTQDSHGGVTKGVGYHPEQYWDVSDGPWGPGLMEGVKGKRQTGCQKKTVEVNDGQFQ